MIGASNGARISRRMPRSRVTGVDDAELLRYSRQIFLPEIDVRGQERLLASTVLIVGVGGLGSAAAMYLAAAGVGTLLLADPDVVELSNLQRQIVHATADIGLPKVVSAQRRLAALNPGTRIEPLRERLEGEPLAAAVGRADAVVDGSDNFPARFAVNRACVARSVPLVSGAALRFEGQIGVFAPHAGADEPCYRCLYDEVEDEAETCSRAGVIAPLLGVVGSIQAVEVLKLLIGAGRPLQGRWLRYDALAGTWHMSRVARDPRCPVCAHGRSAG
jgi:adenylyltransferase/sulfurtransferase